MARRTMHGHRQEPCIVHQLDSHLRIKLRNKIAVRLVPLRLTLQAYNPQCNIDENVYPSGLLVLDNQINLKLELTTCR